ncbi:MAG: 50S ribosomal protein bL37 [Acidimicrobiales bacterium]
MPGYGWSMSAKTNKRKIRARRKKANHGRRPNAGR